MGAVPTGLWPFPDVNAFPTLKRGANNHYAYGAGRRAADVWSGQRTDTSVASFDSNPFEGPPTVKHPALLMNKIVG
jgi:hypothetical protein